MIYAAVLAGGAGKRMQKTTADMPKQFLPLGETCILAHTVSHFLMNPNIDKIFVVVPDGWLTYTEEIFHKRVDISRLNIIKGGSDRNLSLMAAINKINEIYGIHENDIILTHDAVRPFINQRILDENIEACKEFGAAATVYTLTDTPVISENGDTILEIPPRAQYYSAQTPQTFKISQLKEIFESLSEAEKSTLTDAAKMYLLKKRTVKIIMGESYNIKITTPFDYIAAQAYINTPRQPY